MRLRITLSTLAGIVLVADFLAFVLSGCAAAKCVTYSQYCN